MVQKVWFSGRQCDRLRTSAPEAEVSAMAEGFAASIFLFDSLKELKLVKGVGPSCILSMKTDSAIAVKQLNTQSVTVRSRTAAQKLTCLRELVYEVPQVEPIYISGQSQRADGQTKILSGQSLRQAQQHFNLFSHSELRIQVCYHPCVTPRLVPIVEDRELDRVEQERRSPSMTLTGSHPLRGRHLLEEVGGGGSRKRGSEVNSPLIPQERRQYEWYMKKYERADMSKNPNAERERISMIMTALFPHHSHMPPERNDRKVGKKKSPQGETPGESRDEIMARTAAQKQEQQAQRAKAQQHALMHAAPLNVHHMSTRQKAQSTSEASAEKRSRTPSPSCSRSSKRSSSSSSTSSPSKGKQDEP